MAISSRITITFDMFSCRLIKHHRIPAPRRGRFFLVVFGAYLYCPNTFIFFGLCQHTRLTDTQTYLRFGPIFDKKVFFPVFCPGGRASNKYGDNKKTG